MSSFISADMCSVPPASVVAPLYFMVIGAFATPDTEFVSLADVAVKLLVLVGSLIVNLDAISRSVFPDGSPAEDIAGADGAVAGTGLIMDELELLAGDTYIIDDRFKFNATRNGKD